MNKRINKYMKALDYGDKFLLAFWGASSSVCLCSFTATIPAHVGITSASISLVVLVSYGLPKKFF